VARRAERFLLPSRIVRVLEARFHPRKRSGREFVVVGHVYCKGRQAKVLPAPSRTMRPMTEPMMEKLRYLVRESGPEPFEWLCRLASDFWSFVEVETPERLEEA
jgi:hypothetical protein